MKDLRTVKEPDSLLAAVIQQPQFQEKPYQRLHETWFKFKKNWKVIAKWVTIVILTLLVAKYPAQIGYGIGNWINRFTNALTEQLSHIK